MKKYRIFISSVQKEFKKERKVLKTYIYGNPLLREFFEVFIFEDLPAADRRADKAYLKKVEASDIYLGLFGNEYGSGESGGKSPVHQEFLRAGNAGKRRLIFIKGNDDTRRHKKMLSLIKLAGKQLIRRRFNTQPELYSAVYASLVNYLLSAGKIITGPFDSAPCRKAKLSDISDEKIRWFLSRAKSARDFVLSESAPVVKMLKHLDLLDKNTPNNAAILLFGIRPQGFRHLISSEVKCMHFHGLRKLKPIPSYQIYKGTVFNMVDQSVDFVMSKLNRSVGTRSTGPQAPVEYDIPQEVVAEGIVNAVVHRDYTSNASVEIMLFPDRLEIWNPGTLPPSLTIASLSRPHSSQPGNPLIAEPMFLTKYIEKAGSGIVDMFDHCRKAGLKPPQFRLENGFFILIIRRKFSEKPQSQPEFSTSSVPVQYQSLEYRILVLLTQGELSIALISQKLGQKRVSGQLKVVLNKMLTKLFIKYTIPNKPRSRLQRYRLTKKGADYLKKLVKK